MEYREREKERAKALYPILIYQEEGRKFASTDSGILILVLDLGVRQQFGMLLGFLCGWMAVYDEASVHVRRETIFHPAGVIIYLAAYLLILRHLYLFLLRIIMTFSRFWVLPCKNCLLNPTSSHYSLPDRMRRCEERIAHINYPCSYLTARVDGVLEKNLRGVYL